MNKEIKLTEGFTVIDYQATPSGYYQIAFRANDGRTIVCTQTGRGGCNMYQPMNMLDEFTEWLDANAQLAVDDLAGDYPDLAESVALRNGEWADTVVMSICNLIDYKKLRVQG